MLNWPLMIAAAPLAGAAILLIAGRRLPQRACGAIATLMAAVSFIASAGVLIEATRGGRAEIVYATWFLGADWGFLLDPLSTTMAAMVSGVGFLIHVYAIGYMRHHGGHARFFGCMNLFLFSMLLLVLANNYLLMFAGWEGVGLASYLLIGHWYDRPSATNAANKAFLVNRVGDAGLLLGILAIGFAAGTLRFTEIQSAPAWAAAFLLCGAAGKSAQFPLHVWLPDAMEAPTPVSALIHAATMVTAGVYMIARSHFLFTTQMLGVVAVTGAFTALLAATMALVDHDIKRVLAFSTMSQLGYMFLALGVGAWWAAMFHLLTHAFFKALLFLSAGSVIHSLEGERDLRKMGGLRKTLPYTHAAMLIGALALIGAPGLAGFFSKDQILDRVLSNGSMVLFGAGILTAALTAFYMGRLLFLVFYGRPRETSTAAGESPWVMLAPMGVLAIGSVLAGWAGNLFADFFGQPHPSHSAMVIALSIAAAAAGLYLAHMYYLREWRGWFAALLRHRWGIDAAYDAIFVRGFALGGGRALASFDKRIVDGGVNGAGVLARFSSRVSIWWDTWIVDGTVRLAAFLTRMSSFPLRFAQTGQVQSYALIFLIGAAAVFGYFLAR